MAKKPKPLNTIDEVIEALGGDDEIRRIIALARSPSAIPMWRTRKKFPGVTYRILQDALRRRGASAPDKLWGML